MDPTAVNSFLDQFIATADSGFGLIQGDVSYVLNALIAISAVLVGARWALAHEAPIAPYFRWVLFVSFFAFLINNWNALASAINRSGAMLGLKAGGGALTIADLHNPGRIAEIGVELFGRTTELAEGMNLFSDFIALATLWVTAVLVMLAFFLLALQLFVSLIAFKVGALAAYVALPWGVFNGTAWVAERPLGWVAGCAVRLFVLALIASITINFVDTLPARFTIDDGGALHIFLFGLTVLVLSWFGPALASEVVQGQPHLAGADVVQTAIGAAAVGAAGGALALKTAGLPWAAARGAYNFGKGAYSLGQRAHGMLSKAGGGDKAKAAPAINHSKFNPPAKPRGRSKS